MYLGKEKPQFVDLCNCLMQRYGEEWFKLGVLLNIPECFLMLLLQHNRTIIKTKAQNLCASVLYHWLFQVAKNPTWGKIIDAVNDLPITVFSGMYNLYVCK